MGLGFIRCVLGVKIWFSFSFKVMTERGSSDFRLGLSLGLGLKLRLEWW